MPKKASPKPKKPTTKKQAIRRKSKKNRVNNSSEDDAADKTAGYLKKEDYLVIIEWLKIKRNYDSCFGTGKAPAVGYQPNPLSDEGLIQYLQRQEGIITINEKLESMCPHYHAMNQLMGG
ncbi:hypothetical protein VP01_10903g1 [Puccinia sorghi]|uniref:Uncharacterized protein n=1 Tax=Puccinia sorghi TaxID=27349 RepID=A0A0L6VT32_9BASI|nr:hypothetical protein VP01_10903g1 [Puccinia sorghi]